MRDRVVVLRTALALCLVVVVVDAAVAQVQITRDGKRNLVSKDVGDERWAITYNPDDQTATGNVFFPEGGDPAFIWCETLAQVGDQVSLQCYGADACASSPCSQDEWSVINQVELPLAFFFPPNTPCQPELGETCTGSFAGCCDENATCSQGMCVFESACQPLAGGDCVENFTSCCTGSCVGGVCAETCRVIGDSCGEGQGCCPGLTCVGNTCIGFQTDVAR